MDFFIAIILGIIQGITEWLPISSSGQSMLVMMKIFGVEPSEAFSFAIYLHFGTLLAVVIKLRNELRSIIISLPKFREDSLTSFLIVSTLFSALVGIPIYKLLKENFERSQGDFTMTFIGFLLILTGIFLYFSMKRLIGGHKEVKNINSFDMIIAGIAQGFAILPGISRSGVTISTLLLRNFNQATALKISFLMSIPAIIGGIFFTLISGGGEMIEFSLENLVVGILFSFIFGYLTIDALLKFSRKVRFEFFCIVFGFLTIVLGLLNQFY
jgi:undecaprenyl-diphosphatase